MFGVSFRGFAWFVARGRPGAGKDTDAFRRRPESRNLIDKHRFAARQCVCLGFFRVVSVVDDPAFGVGLVVNGHQVGKVQVGIALGGG